jgi:hypothetical protein
MHSNSSGGAGARGKETDDAAPGLQFTYARDLGAAGRGRWGLDSAFSFMDFQFGDRSPVGADLSRLSDAYQLHGVVPPLAPYTGGFSGPSTVIGDTPTRSISTMTDGALVTGERSLRAKYFGFRVGPYWEVPVSAKANFSVSGGFAFAVVDGEFDYTESVFVPGMTIPSSSGANSETDVVLGGYLAGSIHYALSQSMGVYTEVQYQYLEDYTNKHDGRKATLQFGASIMLSVGLKYSF